MTVEERYGYIAYDDKSKQLSAYIQGHLLTVESFLSNLPNTREKALAMTKLEEAFMWVGKAIKADQIERMKTAKLETKQ